MIYINTFHVTFITFLKYKTNLANKMKRKTNNTFKKCNIQIIKSRTCVRQKPVLNGKRTWSEGNKYHTNISAYTETFQKRIFFSNGL